MKIETTAMLHEEIYHHLPEALQSEVKKIVGVSESLGLRVLVTSRTEETYNIAIPGDTSFPRDIVEVNRLSSFFGTPHVAAVHLGSLEDRWAKQDTCAASDIEYGTGKHLGLNGVVRLLNLLRPKAAVITEFGEELDAQDMRRSLTEIVKELLYDSTTIVVPSDVNLFFVFKKDSVLFKCSCGNGYVPIEKISCTMDENSFIKYSFEGACESRLNHQELRA